MRLTPYCVAALVRACESAGRSGRLHASPEHLLLCLAESRDSMACRVLMEVRVSPEQVRKALALFVRDVAGPSATAELSPEIHDIVGLACEEAARLRDRRLGTEHLLLGLARHGESKAAAVLLGLGGSLERLRREVERLRPPGGGVTALSHAAGDAPQVSRPSNGEVGPWWRRVVF
jgi:ATP-dependent Clp protease ATP-binding subunit ClpA